MFNSIIILDVHVLPVGLKASLLRCAVKKLALWIERDWCIYLGKGSSERDFFRWGQ